MPVYEYVARDGAGRPVRGRAQVRDARELASLLRRQGLYLTAVAAPEEDGRGPTQRVDVGPADLADFTHHMATLLGAGLPVFSALRAVEDHADSDRLRRLARALREEVERGGQLSAALERVAVGLPAVFVGIVQSGEATGRLDVAFQRLSAYLEREVEFRRRVREALAYPTVVLAAAVLVVGVFLVYVVPAFERVYRAAGASLPALTQALMAASRVVRSIAPGLVPLAALLAWPGLRRFARTGAARLAERLPGVGGLLRAARAARFLHALGSSLAAGVPVLQAVEVAARAAGRPGWTTVLRARLEGGERLSDAVQGLEGFPPLARRFLGLGEESGQVGEMALRAAEVLDRDVERGFRRLVAGLEPALTVAMAAVVGVLLVALYLPIFGLGRAVLRAY